VQRSANHESIANIALDNRTHVVDCGSVAPQVPNNGGEEAMDGFKGGDVLSVEDATQDDGIPFEKVDTATQEGKRHADKNENNTLTYYLATLPGPEYHFLG
jgi:hypothetical protein